jgi:prepilin-type N-terminal cleavage/methylation domain-containing protein
MLGRCSNNLTERGLRRQRLGVSPQGFTLFELLLVCAVVAVLTAMAYPSIEGMYSAYRVGASTDQVRAAWAEARTHAMNESRSYRFSVKPGSGDFRVAPDASPYWMGSDEPQADDDRTNPPLIKAEELPKPIVFNIVDSGPQMPQDAVTQQSLTGTSVGQVDGAWTTVAVFLPDGSAQDDVKIALQSGGGKPTTLQLRALTGIVTIRTPSDEAKSK